MTLRGTVLLAAIAIVAVGCGKSTTEPSAPAAPKFTATLLPANEVPPVSNADATGSGTLTLTLNTVKDAAGNITSATADFQVSLAGFPAATTLTGAHVHAGAAGATAGVSLSTGLTNGEVVLAGGTGSFTKNSVTVDAALAQAIINNPAGYYFNVHSTINPGGCARGQLVRAN